MSPQGRDPNKPVPEPTTKEGMLFVFGFTQSHCDFCEKEVDFSDGQLRKCMCNRKYFCRRCSLKKEVKEHQDKCAVKRREQRKSLDASNCRGDSVVTATWACFSKETEKNKTCTGAK